MTQRGRHQTTSKECKVVLKKIEALEGVIGVIIGMSYGGKSLGAGKTTGAIRIQRQVSGGLKAVMQSEKGVQEIFIRTDAGIEDSVIEAVRAMS